MKQVFRMIPRGSSNRVVQDTVSGDWMRKRCLNTLLLALLVATIGLTQANAGVETSTGYVKPGESVELVLTGDPGAQVLVTIQGSRGVLENETLVLDQDGVYTWVYRVNETFYSDTLKVRTITSGNIDETEFIVSRMTPSQLAQTLRVMATNSRKQAETALIRAKQDGVITQTRLSMYREALQLLEQSKEYAEAGKHGDAFSAIRSALRLFETVIDESYTSGNDPPEQPAEEKAQVRAREALNSLNKAKARLQETSRKLEEQGYSVDVLENALQSMGEALSKAEEAIENDDIEEAQTQLETASITHRWVMESLRKRANEFNQGKVQRYQTSLANRYNTMQNTLTVLSTVNSDRVSGVLTDLTGLQYKLDQARTLYRDGEYADSVRVLQSADAQFKEAFNKLNGENTKQLLGSLDKLALRLEKEVTMRERQRIQAEMDTIRTTLRNRLQVSSTTDTKAPVRQEPATNTPSLTP